MTNVWANIISGISLVISLIAICISRKAYLSNLKANFFCNSYRINSSGRTITFHIENKGKYAKIEQIKVMQGNISVYNCLPLEIHFGENVDIEVKYKGEDINDLVRERVKLRFHYLDNDNNGHKCCLILDNKKTYFTSL